MNSIQRYLIGTLRVYYGVRYAYAGWHRGGHIAFPGTESLVERCSDSEREVWTLAHLGPTMVCGMLTLAVWGHRGGHIAFLGTESLVERCNDSEGGCYHRRG